MNRIFPLTHKFPLSKYFQLWSKQASRRWMCTIYILNQCFGLLPIKWILRTTIAITLCTAMTLVPFDFLLILLAESDLCYVSSFAREKWHAKENVKWGERERDGKSFGIESLRPHFIIHKPRHKHIRTWKMRMAHSTLSNTYTHQCLRQLQNDIYEQSVYCARDEQSNCRYCIDDFKLRRNLSIISSKKRRKNP